MKKAGQRLLGYHRAHLNKAGRGAADWMKYQRALRLQDSSGKMDEAAREEDAKELVALKSKLLEEQKKQQGMAMMIDKLRLKQSQYELVRSFVRLPVGWCADTGLNGNRRMPIAKPQANAACQIRHKH